MVHFVIHRFWPFRGGPERVHAWPRDVAAWTLGWAGGGARPPPVRVLQTEESTQQDTLALRLGGSPLLNGGTAAERALPAWAQKMIVRGHPLEKQYGKFGQAMGAGDFHLLLSFDPRGGAQRRWFHNNFGFDQVLRRWRKYHAGPGGRKAGALPPSMGSKKRAKRRDADDGLVVWAASNCHAHSRRLEFVQELSDHVSVHSVGKCWRTHTPDPEEKLAFAGLRADAIEREWAWMGARYKFWYAAENYLCDGYVTEKFWVPFAFGSVPVLFGTDVHRKFAPAPDSYVDVREFPDAAALGAYLRRVDEDPKLYARPTHPSNREIKLPGSFLGDRCDCMFSDALLSLGAIRGRRNTTRGARGRSRSSAKGSAASSSARRRSWRTRRGAAWRRARSRSSRPRRAASARWGPWTRSRGRCSRCRSAGACASRRSSTRAPRSSAAGATGCTR